MASAEHDFLAQEIGKCLLSFSETGLLGLTEADRRSYDYACRLERDFSRSLLAQVCWGNIRGINKDLELLLLGSDAPLKLYILPYEQPALLRLDEALGRYRAREETRSLLAGLRCLTLPGRFKAGGQAARQDMASKLRERMCNDLLFAVVFGRLSYDNVRTYCAHNGPLGLKYALLDLVSRRKIGSPADVSAELGPVSNSPMREVFIMLTASGPLYQKPRAMPWHPTVKGRFLRDLIRLLTLEAATRSDWSAELSLILAHLGLASAPFGNLQNVQTELVRSKQGLQRPFSLLDELLASGIQAHRYFGIDPLLNVDRIKPTLYSSFDWRAFDHGIPGNPLKPDEIGIFAVP